MYKRVATENFDSRGRIKRPTLDYFRHFNPFKVAKSHVSSYVLLWYFYKFPPWRVFDADRGSRSVSFPDLLKWCLILPSLPSRPLRHPFGAFPSDTLVAWHGVTSTPAPLYPNRIEHIPSPIIWEFSSCDALLRFLMHPSLVPNLIPFSKSQFFLSSLLSLRHINIAHLLFIFIISYSISIPVLHSYLFSWSEEHIVFFIFCFAPLFFFYNVAVFPFLPSRRAFLVITNFTPHPYSFSVFVVQNIPNTFYTHMPHVSTSARIITQDAVITYTIYPRRKPPTRTLNYLSF